MTSRRVLVLLASVGLVAALAGLVGWPAPNAAAVEPAEPGTVARFSLVVDGVELATFSELGGLTSGYEVAELELKSGPQLMVPSKRKPPAIVLKRGVTQDLTLWAWHEEALTAGPSAWKNADLLMYDFEGRPIARFTFQKAWPSKVSLPALRAGSDEVLMETATIVGEHLQRVAP